MLTEIEIGNLKKNVHLFDWEAKLSLIYLRSGRLQEVVAMRVLTVFPLKNIYHTFCNRPIFPVFRFGVSKPTWMVCLVTLVATSFRFYVVLNWTCYFGQLFYGWGVVFVVLTDSCCNDLLQQRRYLHLLSRCILDNRRPRKWYLSVIFAHITSSRSTFTITPFAIVSPFACCSCNSPKWRACLQPMFCSVSLSMLVTHE